MLGKLTALLAAPFLICAAAATGAAQSREAGSEARIVVSQAAQGPAAKGPAAKAAPAAKNCRREPIWGFRMSPFCKPTGICSDRVIKGYRTVCT